MTAVRIQFMSSFHSGADPRGKAGFLEEAC